MTQIPDNSSSSVPADRVLIGWREWRALPELGIPASKAKIDRGARTSALHAYEMKTYYKGGVKWVRFSLHPLRRRDDIIRCSAEVADERIVTDSGGHHAQTQSDIIKKG